MYLEETNNLSYYMGKFIVRLLSEGKDIHQEHYNRDWELALDLANKYGVHYMNKLKHDGEDFTLDFDVAQLGEGIDWESASYPNDKVKQAVAAIIAFEPTRLDLEKVKEKIGYCRFENRYELERLGQEALQIIEKATLNPGAPHLADAKKESVSALKHTMGKEVHIAVDMKVLSRTPQRDKDSAIKEARGYLLNDINAFLHLATLYRA